MSNKYVYFDHALKNNLLLDLLSYLTYSYLSFIRFLVLICTMGKEIGCFQKNVSKLFIETLNTPVLLSSASHTSSAINSTGTSISSGSTTDSVTYVMIPEGMINVGTKCWLRLNIFSHRLSCFPCPPRSHVTLLLCPTKISDYFCCSWYFILTW